MNYTTLIAQCTDFFGNKKWSSLGDAASCKDIENIDGNLRCVIDKKPGNKNVGVDWYDVISITSDITKNNVETKVWRIDRPNVWQETTPYPNIKFRPGDQISFNAGGCAQTGRHGASWDEYLWPQGDDAPTYYAGTAYVPGVTGSSGRRIGSLLSCQPFLVTAPHPGEPPDRFLSLGYEDNNYSDNGYWNHDNGQRDQCKNVGPAWVEVTVVSRVRGGTPLPQGTKWSPGCKPFDLVWDTDNEDFNGLPLNAQWLFQLQNKGQQPDFGNMCGSAFPDNKSVDYTKLGQECTSQDPTTDIHWALGAICSGWPLQGHLNWMIATYQGPVWFESISGTHLGDNALWDDDYNFDLKPQHGAGLTRSGDQGKPHPPATTIHMEMDPTESINNLGSTYWQQAQGYILPGGALSSKAIHSTFGLNQMFGESHGVYGVVTGLFGLDAEHGGQTELHPIFAMAVRVTHTENGDKAQDHWAFFLRNYGNEGGCASNGLHMWVSPTGEYFVQVPKPEGVTALNQITDRQGWAWDKGNMSTLSFVQSKDWLMVKVRPRDPWSPFGADGEFTAEYTLPAAKKKEEAPPPQGNPKVRQESEGTDLGAKIADPAVKAKFQAAMNALQPAPPKEKVQITVAPEVAVAQKAPGAASKGQITRAVVVPDPVRQQRETQMVEVLRTYQKDLKVEVPANPTSKATVIRSKPAAAAAPGSEPPKPQSPQ